jgi:HD-GYP domain-containing protein (c-di-GMP phosphodiesterase class II)
LRVVDEEAMKKVDELLTRLAALGGEAGDIGRALARDYERELDAMTSHLGQMYEELMLLYGVGEEVAATLDTAVLACQATERIRLQLVARAAVVVLPPEGENLPGGEHWVGEFDGAAPAELVAWATQQTTARDRSLIVNDLGAAGVPPADGVSSLLSCPLRARGHVIGAVHALDKLDEGGFTTEDQALLQNVATQLGAAIESARLFQAAQRHAADLAEALDELGSTYDDTLEALSGALDLRDNETEGHARRVTRYSVMIARALGVGGRELLEIERGALLHDIGKIGVPDSILLKPAKLTDEEWEIMRRHPELGHLMIRNIRFLGKSAPVVLHHHERYDGKGYPAGLVGDAIPLGARIFSVADTFDAMTSDRPYRKALGYEETRTEIERCAGGQFDPKVVASFSAVAPGAWQAVRDEVETEIAARRREGRDIRDMRDGKAAA